MGSSKIDGMSAYKKGKPKGFDENWDLIDWGNKKKAGTEEENEEKQ